VCLAFGQTEQKSVILKIGKQSFTLDDFEKNLEQMKVKYANLNPDMKKRLFDQFVREKLFLTAAKDAGTNLTEEQEKNLERLKMMYLMSNYVSAALKENPVTDTEVRQTYEKNPQQYMTAERRKLRHIIVPAEEKAKEILQQLKNGANFEEIAGQNNTDATKQRGGDLGWAQKGIYVKEFEDIAFSLKKGAISDIVKTQFGYHIIRVDDIEPSRQKSFPEVAQEIKRKIERDRILQMEQQLKKKYKVQIDYSAIEAINKK